MRFWYFEVKRDFWVFCSLLSNVWTPISYAASFLFFCLGFFLLNFWGQTPAKVERDMGCLGQPPCQEESFLFHALFSKANWKSICLFSKMMKSKTPCYYSLYTWMNQDHLGNHISPSNSDFDSKPMAALVNFELKITLSCPLSTSITSSSNLQFSCSWC